MKTPHEQKESETQARIWKRKKERDEPQTFWNKALWADESKINLYHSDGKTKVWRKRGSAHDPNHTGSWLGLALLVLEQACQS